MQPFEHITAKVTVAFTLGIASLFLYAWKSTTENKYMKLTVQNILFHIIASFMVLLGLNEISEVIIDNYIKVLDGSNTYYFTLACLTGMFGSVLVAYILEKGKKIF